MKYAIVACQTLQDELNLAIKETDCQYPVIWVDSEYHIDPNKLRTKLQQEIDALKDVDSLLFAYGSCGNGLVGLTASTSNLIIPKTDDCISMVLCRPSEKLERHKETYFLTKGWIDSSKGLSFEYQHCVQRYGETRARRIFELMLKHYNYLMLIDTGAYNLEEYIGKAEELAQKLKLEMILEKGEIWLLKKLLTGPYDADFCVVQKGGTVNMADFGDNCGR